MNSDALDNAFNLLVKSLKALSEKEDLSDDELSFLSELIKEAYLNRKANLYLENVSDEINQYLKHSFKFALNSEKSENNLNNYTKLFYYRSRKDLLTQ